MWRKPPVVPSRGGAIPSREKRPLASRCAQMARQTATFSQTRPGTDEANFSTGERPR